MKYCRIAALPALLVFFLTCSNPAGSPASTDPGGDPGDTPVLYTVSYDGNGHTDGEPPVDAAEYRDGEIVTVLDPGDLSKDGHTFGGWYIDPDTETVYDSGDTLSVYLSDILFKALWIPEGVEPDPVYTVFYDGNGHTGGDVPWSQTDLSEGDWVPVHENFYDLVRTGYHFAGWNTRADGSGEQYTAGYSHFAMPAEDVTLYARWLRLEDYTRREMVSLPGGTFTQQTEHAVSPQSFLHTIPAFRMAAYETTYELWYAVLLWAVNNGYGFPSAAREGSAGEDSAAPTEARHQPAARVSWRAAVIWCNAYSEMAGLTPVYTYDGEPVKSTPPGAVECDWTASGYRLPSEGKWQYAAAYRDGTDWTPPDQASGVSETASVDDVAWHAWNSDLHTREVGTRQANQAGLYDMSGNAWELCWDWDGAYPSGPETDYRGPASGTSRCARGGRADSSPSSLATGKRSFITPTAQDTYTGFRVARTGGS